MIKKVPIKEIGLGMYIHALEGKWTDHPFFRSSFLLDSKADLRKLQSSNIKTVFIDTDKGKGSVTLAATPEPTAPGPAPPVIVKTPPLEPRVIFKETAQVVRNVMNDARSGQIKRLDAVYSSAGGLVETVAENHQALAGIARIKSKDDYTFEHSVSVAALLSAFALHDGYDRDAVVEIAVGGMLHDVGKSMVPDGILNKPGRLEKDEMAVMRGHVLRSQEILQGSGGISDTAFAIAVQHHERNDGKGYPFRLAGDEISPLGRMAAVVDVYDALTSIRVYKAGWEPTQALRKMLEWAPDQFPEDVVRGFISLLGIYPVGAMVKLKSGLVGLVVEQTGDMLKPVLKLVYSERRMRYEDGRLLDLSQSDGDAIVEYVPPSRYGVDMAAYLE